MGAIIGGVKVDPGGQSLVVDITTTGGARVVVYDAQASGSAHTLPLTITTLTGFYIEDPQILVVSVKRNGVEIAGLGGTTRSFEITSGVIASFAPAVDPGSENVAQEATLVHLAGTETITGAKTFTAAVTLDDINLVLDTTTGTKIGTATTQKLGFYNATPIVQPSAYTQTYATANKTVANLTTTAITDNTTGAAATTWAAGLGQYNLTLPAMPNLSTLSTGGVDVITNIVPGHKFKIMSWYFVTTLAGTNSGATLAFNLEIGATDVGTSPSTCTVTLASTSDIGEITLATAVSGANTGSASDTLTLEVAGGGTAFTAGSGYFVVRVQNMDTADAFAGIAVQLAAAAADDLDTRQTATAIIDDLQALGLVG